VTQIDCSETPRRVVVGLTLGFLLSAGFACALLAVRIPLAGLLLAAACVFAWWAFHHPTRALILAMFLIPCERFTSLAVVVKADNPLLTWVTAPKLMLAGALATMTIRALTVKDDRPVHRLLNRRIVLLVLLFALAYALSIVVSPEPAACIQSLLRLNNSLALAVFLTVAISDARTLKSLLVALAYGYLLVGLTGMYEAISHRHVQDILGLPQTSDLPFNFAKGSFRVAGPSGDPDFFAVSVVLGTLITLSVYRFTTRRLHRVILLGALGVLLFDLVATASRGAALSLAVGLATFWLFARLRHRWLLAAGAVVAGAMLLLVYTQMVSDRPLRRFTGETDTTSLVSRQGWWKQAIEMFLDSPWVGVGSGNFPLLQDRYFDPRVPREPYHAHNTFLQIAAEGGLLALALYLTLFGVAGVMAFRTLQHCRDPVWRDIAVCLLGALMSLAVFSLTSNMIKQEMTWMTIALTAMVATVPPGPFALPLLSRDRVTGSPLPPPS
jgi:putative inorganic carbon (hco3(-)) transporter